MRGVCVFWKASEPVPDIDWFSFIAGFLAAAILGWMVARVLAFFNKVFQPASGKPLKQRASETVRSLITALLLLAVMVIAAYIAYSVLVKPMP
jgi:formate hydrogenlyase subunit 3/multisubunit Na+/H+ antiporter MnhD subunit